eukprot:bmy_17236T0
MPNYKLTYFNMRGRAEIIRYIFAYLDIKYEDHRIEQSDWPEIKSTLPFGKIPILEVDGLNLHQSLAIARYLTKNTDLDTYLGENEWFIGNSVTWADFYWEICSTTLLVFKPDLLDNHPRLVTLRKKVQSIPAIANWIMRRPQTKL